MKAPRWGIECPNGHGEYATVRTWCHDYDDECECETVSTCGTCGQKHYTTCANAGPWDFYEDPSDGDTWQAFDQLSERNRYDAAKDDWIDIEPSPATSDEEER